MFRFGGMRDFCRTKRDGTSLLLRCSLPTEPEDVEIWSSPSGRGSVWWEGSDRVCWWARYDWRASRFALYRDDVCVTHGQASPFGGRIDCPSLAGTAIMTGLLTQRFPWTFEAAFQDGQRLAFSRMGCCRPVNMIIRRSITAEVPLLMAMFLAIMHPNTDTSGTG